MDDKLKPKKSFDQWKSEKEEKREVEKLDPKKEGSLVVGETISWADISEEVGKREWIWENYIAKGHITLLSALWKAGKSTLLRHLFLAIAEEKEFAGQPTTASKVLVVSEETKNEWFDSKDDIDPELIKNIYLRIRPLRVKPNLKQWIEFIQELTTECLDKKIDVVIIDTLSSFWPIDNENDSAQVMKALVPLYNFTENGIAVLLIHHFRKGGGDQAQASRGSGALPGFVDNIIEFTRNEKGTTTQRILRTYGRFDEVIPEIVIELTAEGEYITLGPPWKVSKNARLQAIMDIFAESKVELSAKEVFNTWIRTGADINLRSVQRYVRELFEKGFLVLVKEETVVRKKTPFYAQKLGFQKQTTMDFTVPMGVVVSSVIGKGLSSDLSSVDQNRAGTDDTTTTSPIRETLPEMDPRV